MPLIAAPRRPLGQLDAHSGPCTLSGTLKVQHAPASRPVYLFTQPMQSAALARATRSAPDGSYTFANLKPGQWMVIGVDDTGALKADAVDRITTTAP